MSEKLPGLMQPELPAPHEEKLLEAPEVEQVSHQEHLDKQQSTLETSRQTVEAHATKTEETPVTEIAPEEPKHTLVNAELRSMAYTRLLQRTRKQLRAPARAFSKVAHQPAIEAVSELGSKTIARPNGILGGSIVTLVGSCVALYAAKHYGFTYNFLLFAMLFVAGYAVTVCIETIIAIGRHFRPR